MAALSGRAPGETPLSDDDLAGLKPTWIATRADLNAAEQEGILGASRWLLASRNLPPIDALLTASFADRLHRRMFGAVWSWAGQRRQRVTNIGVEPHLITTKMRDVFDDVRYWHEHPDVRMEPVEIAVRLHHRLVAVHPYPNGNGRHARLLADGVLRRYGQFPLPWGGRDISEPSATRSAYIRALQQADNGDYEPLLAFAVGR